MQINNPMSGAGSAQKASGAASFFAPAATAETSTRQEFSDYMKKTPAEKMRDAILKAMGLDEDKLKAMSPKEREAVEAKIKEMIKTRIEEAQEKKTGMVVDIKA